MLRRIASVVPLAALAAVALASTMFPASSAAGGGGCHGEPEPEGKGGVVSMAGGCFSPTVLRVQPQETVVFQNDSDMQHYVNGLRWQIGQGLHPGDEGQISFNEPGMYPYQCYLHPSMVGVIVVEDGDTPSLREPLPTAEAESAAAPAVTDTADGSDSRVLGMPGWAGALAGLAAGMLAGGAGIGALRAHRGS